MNFVSSWPGEGEGVGGEGRRGGGLRVGVGIARGGASPVGVPTERGGRDEGAEGGEERARTFRGVGRGEEKQEDDPRGEPAPRGRPHREGERRGAARARGCDPSNLRARENSAVTTR